MKKRLTAMVLLLATPAAAQAPSLEMQARCAAQAKKSFEESGWNKGIPTSNPELSAANAQLTEYTNHYNSKLNKCFIEVNAQMQSLPGVSAAWSYKFLFRDAYEGKTYGA